MPDKGSHIDMVPVSLRKVFSSGAFIVLMIPCEISADFHISQFNLCCCQIHCVNNNCISRDTLRDFWRYSQSHNCRYHRQFGSFCLYLEITITSESPI